MSELVRYIEEFSSPRNELLIELERETFLRVKNPQMLSGHIQGLFLEAVTKILRPQRVLEIGTFTGYSALSIAAGLEENAIIDTIEVDDELETIARRYFKRSPVGNKIKLHIGSALDILPILTGSYDMVFIDGCKREYVTYYQLLWQYNLIKRFSWILADNILWYGKVANGEEDPQTKAIAEFNTLIRADKRVENVILPIRDGINLINVK